MTLRRALCLSLIVIAFARAADSEAQPSTPVPRVGVLNPGSATESPAVQREPFERGLRELGWKPGSSIIIEYRYAEGRVARLGELAAELVKLKVDVIIGRSYAAVEAARRASGVIPIVMSSVDDPVAYGCIAATEAPGCSGEPVRPVQASRARDARVA